MNVKLCRAFILNRLVKYVFPICYIVPTESVNIQIFIYNGVIQEYAYKNIPFSSSLNYHC